VKLIEIHKDLDSDFVGRASNLISAIIHVVKEQSCEFLNKSSLVGLLVDILKEKNQNKSHIFSLVGDIHPYIFDDARFNSLSELCRLLTINIRYNDSNIAIAGFSDQDQSISVCNNACWVVGEIAVSLTLKTS